MRLHRSSGVLLVISLSLPLFACDNNGAHPASPALAAPSAFGPPAPFVGTSVPGTIAFTSVPSFKCPLVAPFAANLVLFVDQRRGADVFLDQAGFRFMDRTGLPSVLDLTRADLTGMFGSTLVPGGTTRDFRFRPQFGCGFTAVPASVSIGLLFVDVVGTSHHTTLTAALR